MYSILRIEGAADDLEQCLAVATEICGEQNASISRRGDLTIDLSKSEDWDRHQEELGTRLSHLDRLLEVSSSSGCQSYVDCAVYITAPGSADAGISVRSYRIGVALIQSLESAELPLELTVYVEPAG